MRTPIATKNRTIFQLLRVKLITTFLQPRSIFSSLEFAFKRSKRVSKLRYLGFSSRQPHYTYSTEFQSSFQITSSHVVRNPTCPNRPTKSLDLHRSPSDFIFKLPDARFHSRRVSHIPWSIFHPR